MSDRDNRYCDACTGWRQPATDGTCSDCGSPTEDHEPPGQVVPFPTIDVRPRLWDRILLDLDAGARSPIGLALVEDVRLMRDTEPVQLRIGDPVDALEMLHMLRVTGILYAYAAHVANPTNAALRDEYRGQVLMARHTQQLLFEQDPALSVAAALWFEGRRLLGEMKSGELELERHVFEASKPKLLARGFAEEGARLVWTDPETGGTLYVSLKGATS